MRLKKIKELYVIAGRKGCVKMILAGKENMEEDSFSLIPLFSLCKTKAANFFIISSISFLFQHIDGKIICSLCIFSPSICYPPPPIFSASQIEA